MAGRDSTRRTDVANRKCQRDRSRARKDDDRVPVRTQSPTGEREHQAAPSRTHGTLPPTPRKAGEPEQKHGSDAHETRTRKHPPQDGNTGRQRRDATSADQHHGRDPARRGEQNETEAGRRRKRPKRQHRTQTKEEHSREKGRSEKKPDRTREARQQERGKATVTHVTRPKHRDVAGHQGTSDSGSRQDEGKTANGGGGKRQDDQTSQRTVPDASHERHHGNGRQSRTKRKEKHTRATHKSRADTHSGRPEKRVPRPRTKTGTKTEGKTQEDTQVTRGTHRGRPETNSPRARYGSETTLTEESEMREAADESRSPQAGIIKLEWWVEANF
ncbi:hypothetical protein ACROYT_G033407 [Oculina patagonica]